jgi:hypothetical protein
VEDIVDAKSTADIVLNMNTEGDNEKSALEVRRRPRLDAESK